MANTPQAKKRIRRNARRAEVNGNRVGRIRTFVKKAEAALAVTMVRAHDPWREISLDRKALGAGQVQLVDAGPSRPAPLEAMSAAALAALGSTVHRPH